MKTRVIVLLSLPIMFLGSRTSSVQMDDSVPATVDIAALVDKMGEDLTYDYRMISGAELSTCEEEWEVDLPYGVREIVRLGNGNILIMSRSNRSQSGCEATGMKSEDEEILSLYSPDGSLIHRRSLADRWVSRIYSSADGKLLTLLTGGYDDNVQNIVIEESGEEILTAGGNMILFPSPDGEYLVCSAPDKWRPRAENIVTGSSGKQRIAPARFLNKDGSPRAEKMPAVFDERNGKVLLVFDQKLLFAGLGSTEEGERATDLYLFDIETGKNIWQKRHHELSGGLSAAISTRDAGDPYFLLQYMANDEKIRNAVVEAGSGEIVGRTTGGAIWSAVGSEDGYFYASVTGRLKMGLRFRAFIVKFTPQFHIIRYGVLYDGYSLHEAKEMYGYVWGVHEACTLDDVCYPIVTAIYNMSGESASGEEGDNASKKIQPVLLEGYWFIENITEDKAILIGQLDPLGGALRKISVDKSWIESERGASGPAPIQ